MPSACSAWISVSATFEVNTLRMAECLPFAPQKKRPEPLLLSGAIAFRAFRIGRHAVLPSIK